MKFTDQRDIRAPREAVWAGITDADTLQRCIPGCQEMTGSVEEGFEAVVVQKVGPVKATFRGVVTVLDVVEHERCTLRGEGKGGPAGFAKGEAQVALSEIPEGTQLSYEVEAKVGGKLAQLGGRVVDGVAGRIADQFFDRFKEAVEGPGGSGTDDAGTPAASPAGGGEGTAPSDPAAALDEMVERTVPSSTEAGPAPAAGGATPEPKGAEDGGAAPIGGGPDAAEPAEEAEKKGWLSRLISRDRAAET